MQNTENLQVDERQFLSICNLLCLYISSYLITLRMIILAAFLIFSKNPDYENCSEKGTFNIFSPQVTYVKTC